MVIVAAGEGAKFGGASTEGTPPHVLELHADRGTCGLFRLSCAADGVPSAPSDDELYERDRDEHWALLLQTSGTR